MKLTLLLMIGFCLQVAASGYAQKITLSAKEMPMEQVFKEIKRQSGYLFLYDAKVIKKANNVTLQINDADLLDVLNSCFQNQPLEYQIMDKTILVRPASPKAVVPQVQPLINISGKVTDNAGRPLPGVTVVIKGTTKGNITNGEGEYFLSVLNSDKTLIFTCVGKKKQEITINGRVVINVVMEEEMSTLQEVTVVSTGYQNIPKERATGSFGFVTSQEIEKTPAINLMERLAGKVPGVDFDVRNNVIHIRGQNSYSTGSDAQPLIVVDGFPIINETNSSQQLTSITNGTSTGFAILSRINPDDIESVTFLKDAAAASIWGSRAANGVIVIVTKKGKKAAPSITFNSSVSVSSPADLSKLHTMNSAQYIGLEKELFTKGFITDPAIWTPSSYMPFNENANTSEALEWMFKARRTPTASMAASRDSALAVISGRNNQQQIRDYLLQKAVTQQYNLSISGGGENSTYYISANATNDRPIFRSNNAKTYNFTANITNDFFNKRITLSTGITYNNSQSLVNTAATTALGTSILGLRPYEMLKDANGNNVNRYITFRPEVIDNFTSKGYLPWTYNSIDELNYSNSTTNENRIRLNASIKAQIFNWLDFNISGTYQNNVGETINENELQSYTTRSFINIGTTIAAGKLVYNITNTPGATYRTSNFFNKDYSLRGQFNVNKSWNDIHQLNIIAGSEIRENQTRGYSRTLYGFDDNTYTSQTANLNYATIYGYSYILPNNDGTVQSTIRRYLSYYSNAGYTYLHKYTVSASVRLDDYSMQGVAAKDRAKPLWSAGFKWNVKNEAFLAPIKVINNLNLRLSYGIGGSVPSGGFNVTSISIASNDYYTGKPYATINTPANDQLSWETTKQLNGGIDLGLFNNRLTINFDIYAKKSYGILYNMPFNATYGYTYVTYNAANLNSNGLEFGIQSSIIRKKDFSWNSDFTFAYNTNKVTDSRFPKSVSTSLVTSVVPIVGQSLDYLYVYRWAGLDNTGQSQIYNKKGDIIPASTSTGLTSADLVYAGRKTAPYQGGWSNDISYKNFSLNVHMTYYLGAVFLKNSISNYPTYVGTYTGVIGTQEDLAYRWQNPGDEAITNVPGLTGISNNSITRYKYSDILVRSASHIRLQQIALSYTVPQILVNKTPFKSLSASVSVRNLGIIWRKNKDGIDPQYVSTNSYNNLPPTKNYVFSLIATF